MLQATCHCGAVRIIVPSLPEYLIDCNCSICRRNGALWSLYDSESVKLCGHPENTTQYVWGPHSIRTMHCKVCGCATHWEPIESKIGSKVGVNARNFDPIELSGVKIRKFDGAETWSFID
jgi:hypothetical protein